MEWDLHWATVSVPKNDPELGQHLGCRRSRAVLGLGCSLTIEQRRTRDWKRWKDRLVFEALLDDRSKCLTQLLRVDYHTANPFAAGE